MGAAVLAQAADRGGLAATAADAWGAGLTASAAAGAFEGAGRPRAREGRPGCAGRGSSAADKFTCVEVSVLALWPQQPAAPVLKREFEAVGVGNIERRAKAVAADQSSACLVSTLLSDPAPASLVGLPGACYGVERPPLGPAMAAPQLARRPSLWAAPHVVPARVKALGIPVRSLAYGLDRYRACRRDEPRPTARRQRQPARPAIARAADSDCESHSGSSSRARPWQEPLAGSPLLNPCLAGSRH